MTNNKLPPVANGFNLGNIKAAEHKRRLNAKRARRYRTHRNTDGKVEVRVRVRPKHRAAIKQLEKELNQL